jgi:hypothetical protein
MCYGRYSKSTRNCADYLQFEPLLYTGICQNPLKDSVEGGAERRRSAESQLRDTELVMLHGRITKTDTAIRHLSNRGCQYRFVVDHIHI